jgi:signal transduction histidine kinase
VQTDVRAGQQDVAAAARHALAHGPLLALRHAVLVLPWAGETFIVQSVWSRFTLSSRQVATESAAAAACCKTAAVVVLELPAWANTAATAYPAAPTASVYVTCVQSSCVECSSAAVTGVTLTLCHGEIEFKPLLPAELGTAGSGTRPAVQAVLEQILDRVAQAAQVALPALARPQTASTGAGTQLCQLRFHL